MKKLLLLILCLVLLCGCATEKAPPSSGNITVDADRQILSDGKYTYRYEIDGAEIIVTYPNGEKIFGKVSNGAVTAYGSGADLSAYADETELLMAVHRAHTVPAPVEEPKSNPVFRCLIWIAIIILGLLAILKPKLLWKLKYGLWVKDPEPTDFAIGWVRFAIIIAIVILAIVALVMNV